MSTNNRDVMIRAAVGVLAMAALLAGCKKPTPAESPPQVAPAIPDAPAPADSTPSPADASGQPAQPTQPAQPAPDAPPPTEPSPAPTPTAASEPALDSMQIATPTAKASVPVDLRYQFDGAALSNQPVTLHLAAVPRVPGVRVNVTVKQVNGVQIAAGPLTQQKAEAAEVYRRQFSVTRGDKSPSQLRVLVTMDYASGSAFGFYSVPLDGGTIPQKQDSVKPR